MPLKCELNGKKIYTFLIPTDQFKELKGNKNNKIKLQCCNSEGIFKTSSLGLQYVAHKVNNSCPHCGESKEHELAKIVITNAIKKTSYQFDIEHELVTCSGNKLYVDVLAFKNNIRIAFEVQLSPQTNETTEIRTRNYADNNINRTLWFFGKSKFHNCIEIPSFNLWYNEKTNIYTVRYKIKSVYSDIYTINMELESFIISALNGKLKYKPLQFKEPDFINIYSNKIKCNIKFDIINDEHSFEIKRDDDLDIPINIYSMNRPSRRRLKTSYPLTVYKIYDLDLYYKLLDKFKFNAWQIIN